MFYLLHMHAYAMDVIHKLRFFCKWLPLHICESDELNEARECFILKRDATKIYCIPFLIMVSSNNVLRYTARAPLQTNLNNCTIQTPIWQTVSAIIVVIAMTPIQHMRIYYSIQYSRWTLLVTFMHFFA